MKKLPPLKGVEFGRAAKDYAVHRKGFPESFFELISGWGIGRPGQRILDLGTGTGSLARGLALRGADVSARDIDAAMIAAAKALDRKAGAEVSYSVGRAEATGFAAGSFELITAGHCWHWFDGPRAARECFRLLKSGGRLLIAHFSYLPLPGTAAALTEQLILKFNPAWPLAGNDGLYELWRPVMERAGFREIESEHYDEDDRYSQEAWRGRIRACNGVLALKSPARILEFDAELKRLLKRRYAARALTIPHRIFAIRGRKP